MCTVQYTQSCSVHEIGPGRLTMTFSTVLSLCKFKFNYFSEVWCIKTRWPHSAHDTPVNGVSCKSVEGGRLRSEWVAGWALQAFLRYCDKRIGVTSLTFQGHVTSSITWPFDSPYAISYWWSFGTKPQSLTVSEIFNVKCNATVHVTLIRPLNKGQSHSFWYQSISHIRLPIGSQ